MSERCFDHGCLGITEEEGDGKVLLRAYFERDGGVPAAVSLQKLYPDLRVTVDDLPYGDWAEAWKEHFRPLRVGERFIIAPTWEEVEPKDGDLVLRIDPGMAFGTGGHATTRLCLEWLEELLTDGSSVLDIGTGSAILSIGAARLGATRVRGIDIDEDALDSARENLVANELTETIQLDDTPISKLPGTWDVVVANILADVLESLATDIIARVEPGGTLLLSGILVKQADHVIEVFEAAGVTHTDTRTTTQEPDRWAAILFARR